MINIPKELPLANVSALAMLINDHVDRIAKKPGEFDTIGKLMREVFAKPHFNRGELGHRILRIMQQNDLSMSTQVSLRKTLTAIAEIYDAPEEWIQKPFYSFHQQIVLERVNRRADQLMQISDEEQRRETDERAAAQSLSRANQKFLQGALQNRLLKRSEIMGKATHQSTLNEVQQREEDQFYYFIVDHGLEQFRDSSLPLNEDVELLRHLARDEEYWPLFNALPNLFKTSKSAAIVLISEGVMTLNHFDRSLRSDKDVILAGATQGRYARSIADDATYPFLPSPRESVARSSSTPQLVCDRSGSFDKMSPTHTLQERWSFEWESVEIRSNRLGEVRAATPEAFWANYRNSFDE